MKADTHKKSKKIRHRRKKNETGKWYRQTDQLTDGRARYMTLFHHTITNKLHIKSS